MGDTGSPYNLPYPELTDAPDVPSDIESLAEAVDTELTRIDSDLVSVNADITTLTADTRKRAYGSFTTAGIAVNASDTTAITFPVGLFDEIPHVNVSTDSSRCSIGVVSLTTAGCSIILSNWSSATSAGVVFNWEAVEKVT